MIDGKWEDINNMAYSNSLDMLVAGCEDGLMAWKDPYFTKSNCSEK